MKYYKTIPEEQETIITLDYFTGKLFIYSSKKSVLQRLYNKLGDPIKTHFIESQLTGASWELSFDDKRRINIALSRPLLIGQIKSSNKTQ